MNVIKQKMTKAELRRRLTKGTKLTLINCLTGPCHSYRTVHKQSNGGDHYEFLTEDNRISRLRIQSTEYVQDTGTGFAIRLKENDRIMVQYEWGHIPYPEITAYPPDSQKVG